MTMETSLIQPRREKRNSPNLHLILFSLVLFLKIIFTVVLNSTPFFWAPSMIISLGLFFVPFSFIFLFSGNKGWMGFFLLNFLTTLVLISDCLYYSYFHSPFSIYTLFQLNNLAGLGESIFHILDFKYLLFFIDLLVFPFFSKQITWKMNKIMFALFFISGMMIWLYSPLGQFHSDDDDAIFRRFDNRDSFSFLGPIGYHFLDAMFFVKNINKKLTAEEMKEIQNWFDKKKPDSASPEYKAMGKGKNLIMIQVESLQNFVIHQTVNGQEITPNLNRLLKNSLYFTRFYPQTMEGNSSDAEFLVNTSLFPLEKGSVYFRYPNNRYPSLPYLLKKEGYDTFAIHADEGSFWNRAQVYPHLGFNHFYDITSFHVVEEIGMGLSDDSMFRQSVDILEDKNQPYYSFLITLTSHMPFTIPDQNKRLKLTNEMKGSYLGDYFQSIRYTDESIGRFMGELEKRNMLQDSIIVIYGDHDGIFEKDKPLVENWMKKRISPEEWIRHYRNVPFIIYNPSIQGKTFDVIGGEIDVLPTLSHIMGIYEGKISHSAMGTNLFAKKEGSILIPSGDYNDKPVILTETEILDPDQEHTEALDVARLIIEGNYFKGDNVE